MFRDTISIFAPKNHVTAGYLCRFREAAAASMSHFCGTLVYFYDSLGHLVTPSRSRMESSNLLLIFLEIRVTRS